MRVQLGSVDVGDIFYMEHMESSGFLHIVEMGHGFCTFQFRGLEMQGKPYSLPDVGISLVDVVPFL